MTTTSPIHRDQPAAGVTRLTLARPDAMNSLDRDTKEATIQAFREISEDPETRAVILTGEGRAFCVGQDLKEHVLGLQSDKDGVWSTVQQHYSVMATLLATMPKPVIAAVNGVAAGAGASLTFAADFRVMASSASYSMAFSNIALSCDTGTSWFLPRLVGWAKATELLMLPSTIRAEEALQLGLVTSVVDDDQLAASALELATRLAQGPTMAYSAMKQALAYSASHDLSDTLDLEATLMRDTGLTEDHSVAVEAFLAKEKPQFQGR